MNRAGALAALWLMLPVPLSAWAQTRPARPQPVATPAPSPPAPTPLAPAPASERGDEEYRVGVGDVLDVVVLDNDDLSRATTVQTTGSVTLPLLGEVPVAGLTVGEVQRKVTALLARDYLVNPQVEVRVREYQSRFVTVLGEVNAPGRKALRGRTRLIDVLVDAGGFSPRASGELMVTRSQGQFPDGTTVLRLRLSSAAPGERERASLELPLQHGDIVTAAPKFYVTVEGEVQRPGRFVLDADLTVTGAISTAGGLTRFGANNVKLRRTDPQTGRVTVQEVDLKAVRSGKQPDPALMPNDLISVPRRRF